MVQNIKKTYILNHLLRQEFGASTVVSIDYSDYEGANIIHDMNYPISQETYSKFDTVIDAGSLEHVYNAPQALKNCSLICNKSGGQIVHILPSNNYCGHGFWQFSPELFFSLYSKENGYRNTEIFLADLSDNKYWYKVIKPHSGQRVIVTSKTPVYCLVRTVLSKQVTGDFSDIQQSDYIDLWSDRSEKDIVKKQN